MDQLGRFDLAKGILKGALLKEPEYTITSTRLIKDIPSSNIIKEMSDGKVKLEPNSLLELRLQYNGNGKLTDGRNVYELAPKDYDTLEKKAELCALIAEIEHPEDVIDHAVSLMENSVEDLINMYNRVRGYYRGIYVKE